MSLWVSASRLHSQMLWGPQGHTPAWGAGWAPSAHSRGTLCSVTSPRVGGSAVSLWFLLHVISGRSSQVGFGLRRRRPACSWEEVGPGRLHAAALDVLRRRLMPFSPWGRSRGSPELALPPGRGPPPRVACRPEGRPTRSPERDGAGRPSGRQSGLRQEARIRGSAPVACLLSFGAAASTGFRPVYSGRCCGH